MLILVKRFIIDRGHVHHRLIDMGLSQKQAVAILYFVSIIFGLAAVVLTTSGPMKVLVLVLAFVAVGTIAFLIIASSHKHHRSPEEDAPPAAPVPPKDEEKP